MPKEVFISYCSENADIAEAVCGIMESGGRSCWIAPGDVAPGAIYAEEIIKAIKNSEVFALICSSHTSRSAHVRNEVERAFSQGKTIIPLRVENAPLGEALEYFLATSQWVDAWTHPVEESVRMLADSVSKAVGRQKIVKCPSCGNQTGESARFCGHCGSKLERTCPCCGHTLTSDGKFCEHCGAAVNQPETSLEQQFEKIQATLSPSVKQRLSVAADGENRLVTVLNVDLTSSAETASDGEDTAELVDRLLSTFLDNLSRHECRIDRIIGNQVIAVFGVPHAHEDDAIRALSAAIAARDAVGRLDARISVGINTGRVYFGPMGSDENRQTTVVGPVVDMAARFQGEAAADEIIVGKTTFRQARKSFQFEPVNVVVRGLDEPVEAYKVVRVLLRQDKARGIEGMQSELVGRDEELHKLKQAIEKIVLGSGQMASIIGEAGVGKSRLVAELRGFAEDLEGESRIRFVEGRCVEHGSSASYLPFLDLFRAYFGWAFGETDESRATKIILALERLVRMGHLSRAQMDETLPLLAGLLSVKGKEEWQSRLLVLKDRIKQKTFSAIQDVLVALSLERPIVIVLEDLHWSDDLSLDLIPMLMEILPERRVMLLCIYRPEGKTEAGHLARIAEQKCKGSYTELRLHDLTRDQSRQMVDSLLRIENLPVAVKETIFDRAQGNPFFVEEVVRSLIDEGMVYSDGEKWNASEHIGAISVPESVQSVILGRIDRLSDELKELLQVASVMGRLFKPSVLKRIIGNNGNVEECLYELEERWLVYLGRTVPEQEYSFKHALTRETVYNSILKRRRAELHRKVAESMEGLYEDSIEEYYEDLAYHYGKTDATGKAVEYLHKAGERAIQLSANEEGVEHLRNAIALLGSLPESTERDERELSLQLLFFAPLSAIKGYGHPDVMNAMERAYDLSERSENQLLQFETVYGLLGSNMVRGDLHKTMPLAKKFLSIAETDGNPDHLLEAHRMMDETLHLLGDYKEALEHNERVYPLYDSERHRAHAYFYGQDPAAINYCFQGVGMWCLGYPEKGLHSIKKAYECVKNFDHPFSRGVVFWLEEWLTTLMRDWVAGLGQCERLIAYCNEHNIAYIRTWATCNAGQCLTMSRNSTEGVQTVKEAFDTFRLMGTELPIPMYLPYLAEMLGTIGEIDEALNVADEAECEMERTGVRWTETELLRIRGELLVAKNREEGAASHLAGAIDLARKKQARSFELRATISMSRLLRAQGKIKEAHSMLSGIYNWFTEGFDTPDLREAKALLEELS